MSEAPIRTGLLRELRADEGSVLVLEFDRARLDAALLEDIESAMAAIDRAAGRAEIAGVLLRGGRQGLPDGPDPETLLGCEDADSLEALARRGAEIARRLERLPVPVVALLSGRCRDAGLELGLAAHLRLAGTGRGLRIGLPGIDAATPPLFGGISRLQGLVGLGQALDLVLERRELGGKRARELGLVSELHPEGELEQAGLIAIARLREDWRRGRHRRNGRGWRGLFDLLAERYVVLHRLELGRFRRRLNDLERPASCARSILEIVGKGLALPRFERLEREVAGCAALLSESGPRHRLSILARGSDARRGGPYAPSGARIALPRSAAILGASRVGVRLALGLLGRGLRVSLFDAEADALIAARRQIDDALEDMVEKRRLRPAAARRVRDRLLLAPGTGDLSDIELALECSTASETDVVAALSRLIERTTPRTLLVHHGCTLSPRDLHGLIETDRRLQVLHLLRPEQPGSIGEIVRDRDSHHADLAVLARILRELGGFPLITGGEAPFALGRLVTIWCCGALTLLAEGYSPRTIDRAATDFGFSMGPLMLLDLVGLDVVREMGRKLENEPIVGFRSPELLDRLVARGETGVAAGRGIRDWMGGRPRPRNESELRAVAEIPPVRIEQHDRDLLKALALPLTFEAKRMLDMHVVDGPDDLDLASVHALGFPAERGGLATYAAEQGS